MTHVITDREEWYKSKGGGSNPKTPQGASHDVQHDASDVSPKVKIGSKRPVSCQSYVTNSLIILKIKLIFFSKKSRADAMLQEAQKSSASSICSKNPFDNAKLWGVTIWTAEKVRKPISI